MLERSNTGKWNFRTRMECSYINSGPWFNIKMSSYQYRESHCGDKTVIKFPILVRCHLYIESGPCSQWKHMSTPWIFITIESSANITRSNLVRYCINSCMNSGRISIKGWTHKRHPIPHPNGQAIHRPKKVLGHSLLCELHGNHQIWNVIFRQLNVVARW